MLDDGVMGQLGINKVEHGVEVMKCLCLRQGMQQFSMQHSRHSSGERQVLPSCMDFDLLGVLKGRGSGCLTGFVVTEEEQTCAQGTVEWNLSLFLSLIQLSICIEAKFHLLLQRFF